MLENTLMDLKRMLRSYSSVICGGHHNHIIHPARHEAENDYGDFWGESILESSRPTMKSPKEVCETVDDQDSGRLFINVVRMNSLKLTDIKKVGISLNFDDDVISASSEASDQGDGRHRRDSSTISESN
jgi:hypothetical protein